MKSKLGAVVLVAAWAQGAHAQPAAGSAARDELLKTDREWAQAAATTDIERIVAYWTDDAVIYAGASPRA